jgi:DNA-binding NarL/FixJ family response regulator
MESNMSISLIIVEHNLLYRQELCDLLKGQYNYKILGEAGNSLAALRLCHRLRPDVVVLDWEIPDLSVLGVIRYLSQHQPETQTVLLSKQADIARVSRAVHSGVCGYILKEDANDHLIQAINAAAIKHLYFSPKLNETIYVNKFKKNGDVSTHGY